MNRVAPWASSLFIHLFVICSIWAIATSLNKPACITLCDFNTIPAALPKLAEPPPKPAPTAAPKPTVKPKPVAKAKNIVKPKPVAKPKPATKSPTQPIVNPEPVAKSQPLPEPVPAMAKEPVPTEAPEVPPALDPQPIVQKAAEVPAESAESILRAQEERYFGANFSYIRDRVISSIRYPLMARRMGLTGQVKVEFTILLSGKIKDLKIINSSGHRLLDKQAMRAVRSSEPFPPPPVIATITLPINFELN